MLAERLSRDCSLILLHDALEVSAVDSLAGFNLVDELITRPPYMTHTIRHRLPASSGAVNEWQSQARFRAPMPKFH